MDPPGYTLFDRADRLRNRRWQVPAYILTGTAADIPDQRILVRAHRRLPRPDPPESQAGPDSCQLALNAGLQTTGQAVSAWPVIFEKPVARHRQESSEVIMPGQ